MKTDIQFRQHFNVKTCRIANLPGWTLEHDLRFQWSMCKRIVETKTIKPFVIILN